MLADFWSLFVDLALWLPRLMFEMVADGIDILLALLPTEALGIQSAINGWPSDVVYFLNIIEFDYALTAYFTALIARFLLRRIPFIG